MQPGTITLSNELTLWGLSCRNCTGEDLTETRYTFRSPETVFSTLGLSTAQHSTQEQPLCEKTSLENDQAGKKVIVKLQ